MSGISQKEKNLEEFIGGNNSGSLNKKFRAEELKARKRLREVRKSLRQDIEALGNWLLGLNILLIPTFVAFMGVFSYRSRTRKRIK